MKNTIKCSIAGLIALITGGTYLEADNSNKSIGDVYIDGEYVTTLRITPKGLALIGNAEGCKLDPYRCPAGLKTNGVGNTHNVPDKRITEAQAAKDWVLNIKQAELCLAASKGSTDLSNAQWDGLTSFVFNTGCSRFRFNKNGSKTLIYKLTNQGEYAKACGQLERWIYANGEPLKGLKVRRGKEYDRCTDLD